MEFFAILALLAAIGAGQQSSSIEPMPGGEPVKCQVKEMDAEQFQRQGGLFGYISRNTKNEVLAGTWAAARARFSATDGAAALKKFEAVTGKPLDQVTEADAEKLVDEFGYVVAIPKISILAATTLYTERAWPPAAPDGMKEALGLPDTAGDRGVVARYSLIGDRAGKVRVMGCTVPSDSAIHPNHIARVAGPGDEVPGWAQCLLKSDPKVAKQLDFAENAKKMARLLDEKGGAK